MIIFKDRKKSRRNFRKNKLKFKMLSQSYNKL